jgi:hypothetical protein
MKKEWKKPQLVVLVRGSAEENVLDSCKIASTAGPYDSDGNCTSNDGRCGICEADGNS